MRILHISTRLIVGGSQENTLLSAMGAVERGHQVAIAHGPIYGPEGSLLPRIERERAIEAIEVPDLVRELAPLGDVRCLDQLRHLIRQWRPDVVHTHSSKAGILGRAAAWKERTRVIVHTIHGLPFHPFQSRWRNGLYVTLERWAAHRCHALVTVGDSMTRQALARGIGRPSMYTTIRSPIDTAQYLTATARRAELRARFGWDESVVVLGTIARLAELKGHDDILSACEGLLRSQGAQKVALLWVGDGWWRERLVERIRFMGLADSVALTGLVDPSEIPSWVAAMDVVVHPSYREGLPRSIVQAMLGAKAVVGYDIDGTSEVLADRVTGVLVKPGDIAGLRAAIEWLVASGSERARLGEAGRQGIAGKFEWKQLADQLLALYATLGAPA